MVRYLRPGAVGLRGGGGARNVGRGGGGLVVVVRVQHNELQLLGTRGRRSGSIMAAGGVRTPEAPDAMGAAAAVAAGVLDGLAATGVFAAAADRLGRIFRKMGRGGTPSDP